MSASIPRTRAVLGAVFAVGAMLALAGCFNQGTQATDCPTGVTCAPGWECAAAQAACILDGCGNGRVQYERGEVCDDGNILDGDGCSADCLSNESCGNGYTDVSEDCDEGDDDLVCDGDCTVPVYGDGVADNTAACDRDCSFPRCGDGVFNEFHLVQPDDGGAAYLEACDDGNDENRDDCLDVCLAARCGDGFVHSLGAGGETCDVDVDGDGVADNVAACDSDCTAPACGDGVHNAAAGEACDDGNEDDGDACVSGCAAARCGDGFVFEGEELCDDGNASNGDACPTGSGGSCEPARCGDGFIQAGVEQCDVGNGAVDTCAGGSECQPPNLPGACSCQFT
ncbi:DUF4215 domain-containing protein [Haliangium ochraceum]|nr:DUF4215 domain-containing protein [Haliangium ochraceum]